MDDYVEQLRAIKERIARADAVMDGCTVARVEHEFSGEDGEGRTICVFCGAVEDEPDRCPSTLDLEDWIAGESAA